MIIKEIEEAITFGNYQLARVMISVLPTKYQVKGKVLRSRIDELNGFFNEAKKLAEAAISMTENQTSNLYLEALNAKFYAQWRLGEFSDARSQIKLYSDKEKINPSPDKILEESFAVNYNIAGLIEWSDGNLDLAETLISQGLNLRKKIGQKIPISYSLNNLGNIELKRGNYDKADQFFRESFKLREQLNCEPGLAASFNSLGRLLDAKEDFERAIQNQLKSIEIWLELGNIQFQAKSLKFLAISLVKKNDLKTAEQKFLEAIRLFDLLNNEIDKDLTKQLYQKMIKN